MMDGQGSSVAHPHPDAMIRLVSAVHRFCCPEIVQARKLSFVRSFRTVGGTTEATLTKLKAADRARSALAEATVNARGVGSGSQSTGGLPQEMVVRCAREYNPLIATILLSCRVQAEAAQLDERLVFEWSSGMEITHTKQKKRPKTYQSEAIMYEHVMVMACEALGMAGQAADASRQGKFPEAAGWYRRAAGVWSYLEHDVLPKWIAHGTDVECHELPVECRTAPPLMVAACGVAAQQMALATLLLKPGRPPYGMASKLCRGTATLVDQCASQLRSGDNNLQQQRLDGVFSSLLAFQLVYQKALACYFQARQWWEIDRQYGRAIAMLDQALTYMKPRDSVLSTTGLPDVHSKQSPLHALANDVQETRLHMQTLLTLWEKDNSTVYFDKVEIMNVKKGEEAATDLPGLTHLAKPVPYTPPDHDRIEPIHFEPPSEQALRESTEARFTDDERLAQELQDKLNRGEDI